MSSILDKENIYLMEVMIDRIKIDPSAKLDLKFLNAETCVAFGFFNNGPFYICEGDFFQQKLRMIGGCSGCGRIKFGKSILFSMTKPMLDKARKEFNLDVEVWKNMSSDPIMGKTSVGLTTVNLVELFGQLLLCMSKQGPPCTKTMKQCFTFKATSGQRTGQISIYVRLSCFGKVIVTNFQMDPDQESISFSSTKGKNVYKYARRDYPLDPCFPGYPCISTCRAVEEAKQRAEEKKRMYEEMRKLGLDGFGGPGGRGGAGGGKDENGGIYQQSGEEGEGMYGRSRFGTSGGGAGGRRGSKDSNRNTPRNSKDSGASKKGFGSSGVPFIGGPGSGGAGLRMKRKICPCNITEDSEPYCGPCGSPCRPTSLPLACSPQVQQMPSEPSGPSSPGPSSPGPCGPCVPCRPCTPCGPCGPPAAPSMGNGCPCRK